MTISMQELERRRPVLERALDARDKLSRLRQSESWRQRYFSGDPDAIAEYDRLVAAHADGTAIAREVKFGSTDPGSSEARLDADALLKHQERISGMTADSDFVQRYAEGDVAALRAFNQASVGGAEHLTGASADKGSADKEGSAG
jgi:hypothetical protein